MLAKLNKTQKRIMLGVLGTILISVIVWMIYGGEIWTKTQVLVEMHDDLFDSTYREWKDKFVLGLDYILAFDGIVFIAGALGVFITRSGN